MQIIQPGVETHVNTDNFDVINLDTTTQLSNGNYIVTWYAGDYLPGTEIGMHFDDVHAQIFDQDGNKIGAEFVVNSTLSQDQYASKVVALGDGGFAVLWLNVTYVPESIATEDYTIETSTVVAQRFDAMGNRVNLFGDLSGQTSEVTIGSDAGDILTDAASDGRFVIGWHSLVESGWDAGYHLTFFNADGTITGTSHYRIPFTYNAKVVVLEEGTLLIYSAYNPYSLDGSRDIFTQRFDRDGGTVGGPVTVNTQEARTQHTPSVTELSSGGYVIVWTSRDETGRTFEVRGQVFDASGQKTGGEFQIEGTDYDSGYYYPEVTALDGGYFAVAWNALTYDNDTDVFLQVVNSAGQLMGERFQLSDSSLGLQSTPRISSDGDTIHVTWSGVDAEGHATIFTRQFQFTAPFDDGDNSVEGDAHQNTYDGQAGHDTIHGLNGDDVLSGSAGTDKLYGDDGDDWLDGGSGVDLLFGGKGNDSFIVNSAHDMVVEFDGEGTDTIRSTVNFAMAENVEDLILEGTGNLIGAGNGLNNTLTGNLGNNILRGGLGDDTYYIQNIGDVVQESAGEGADIIYSSVNYSLVGRVVETLVMTGEAALEATGNSLANILIGNSVANLIDGGGGVDTMTGGAGNDTYVVNLVTDNVVELAGGGVDQVNSFVSLTLGSYIEKLTLIGSANIRATGNMMDNVLTGNDGRNALDGAQGADTMAGGLGSDTYYVDNAGDWVVEASNAGIDVVITATAWELGANVENLVLTGGANVTIGGNALDNRLSGNDGHNRIGGGPGADTLLGGVGDDTYLVDSVSDFIVEAAGEGVDLVEAYGSYVLRANVENLRLISTGQINATGNSLDNQIWGSEGHNVLNGVSGADTMAGGRGNDTYYVDNVGDKVLEGNGEGIDMVYAGITYSLTGIIVENLTLSGTAGINATGNSLSNRLIGNSGQNVLNGMGNRDYLVGGLGADVFLFAAGNGVDTIEDFNASDNDKINIAAYTHGIGGNGMVTQSDQNVLIDLGGGNLIFVENTTQADVLSHIIW